MSWGKKREHRTLTGRPWRRLREQVLQRDNYLCQCAECAKRFVPMEATEVDHIIPLAKGGSDKPENLRAMSKSCHSKKTERESIEAAGGKVRQPAGADGWPIK